MRNYLLFILSIFIIGDAKSQTRIQDFGKFTSEERKLKDCSFDQSAEAIILFDRAIVFHNYQNTYTTYRRIRFKILSNKGLHRANIEIPYYSKNDYEYINEIDAIVETPDMFNVPVSTKIGNADIVREKVDEYSTIVKIALPNAKVGSIIEYQYTSTIKGYGGYSEWFFQSDIPTLLSSITLNTSKNGLFTYQVFKKDALPIFSKMENDDTKMSFEMSALPGLKEEYFGEAKRDCLQRIQFQLASFRDFWGKTYNIPTTWDEFSIELLNSSYFGNPINKNIDGSKEIIIKAKSARDEFSKMSLIYEFIASTFHWNGISSKFAPKGLNTIWQEKAGTSGEINLVLIHLLKESGLTVYPLLASTRSHGRFNPKQIFIDQFNKVLAMVEIGKDRYVLDGVAKNTPPSIIPFDIFNSYALVVRKKNSGFIKLSNENGYFKDQFNSETIIDSELKIRSAINRKSFSYSRIQQKGLWQEGIDKFKKQYQNNKTLDIEIDSIQLKFLGDSEKPLEQNLTISWNANYSGNYLQVPLFPAISQGENPFVSDQRYSNINFGAVQQINAINTVIIPSDMEAESIPNNQSIDLLGSSLFFSRNISQINGAIIAEIKLMIKRTVFTPDEYPSLKEFYKKMIEILNEPLVLKKK